MTSALPMFNNWLTFHVFTTIAASLSLVGGAFFSLIMLRQLRKEGLGDNLKTKRFYYMRSSGANYELARRLIVLGYILWGLGLISGAIFSQMTWHRYWSWEPRELFSAITFVYYTAYLAGLYIFKWKARLMAKLGVIGIAVVIFTAIFVDILGGLHAFQTTTI